MLIISLYITFITALIHRHKYDMGYWALWILPLSNYSFKIESGPNSFTIFLDFLLHLIFILAYLDSTGIVNVVVKIC
jgi:hypothetical protein